MANVWKPNVWRMAGPALTGLLIVAACGGSDGPGTAADPERFCSAFEQGTISPGPGDADTIAETRAFVARLDDAPPPEIADEIETLGDGLDALADAMAEAESGDGAEVLRALEESDGASLDRLTAAAGTIEEYAAENCETVEGSA